MKSNQVCKNFISLFIFLVTISCATCQASKNCSDSYKIPSEATVYIESFSAMKCMRVEGFGIKPDSNVVLDECLYKSKPNASQDQQFEIANNSLNKTMIKNNAGRGDKYCLVLGNDYLRNTLCNANNMAQSWSLKPVRNQPSQFLIEQFSSKKCLMPSSRATKSKIGLVPCNSLQTEQIWKIYVKPAGNQSKHMAMITCGDVLKFGSSLSSI